MTIAPRDRVTVSWSPPGTTERVETTGVVVALAAVPVAYRRTPAPAFYDVLTDDGVSRHGLPAAALRRIEG